LSILYLHYTIMTRLRSRGLIFQKWFCDVEQNENLKWILHNYLDRNSWIKEDSIYTQNIITTTSPSRFHNLKIAHYFTLSLSSHFTPHVGQNEAVHKYMLTTLKYIRVLVIRINGFSHWGRINFAQQFPETFTNSVVLITMVITSMSFHSRKKSPFCINQDHFGK